MMVILCIIAVIGFGWGLWSEFSEQRRVGRMADNLKKHGARP